MLENFIICNDHQRFIDGKKRIVFHPGLNVIVGPNGSGKSTLLKAIYECPDCQRTHEKSQKYHYYNSELMNPHRNGRYFKGYEGSIIRVRAMFSSHGETMRDVLRYITFEKGDTLLLDEPETGHDLKWIIKLRKGLTEICQKGIQIITASHHPIFWDMGNLIELKKGYKIKALKSLKKEIFSTEEG